MVKPPDDVPMTTPRVAAGVLFHDEVDKILLVRPTYKDGWDIPGGYVEPNETPRNACIREAIEEIGLSCIPGRLLVVDWAPHPNEGDKILFVFDGGTLTTTEHLTPDGEEITEARFHHPDTLPDLTPDRLARRLALAITARQQGLTAYAEHGIPIP
jgi:8-oxo-dGTP diphosphatase